MSADRDRLEDVVTAVEGWIAQFPEIEQLLAERARYRDALERIIGQGAAARDAYYDGRGIAATLPAAQRIARAALDGELTDE